jgi:hypothetical protein
VGLTVLVMSGALSGSAAGVASTVGPDPADFTDIGGVPVIRDPAREPGASTGTVTEDCGRDEEGHRNSDNLVVSPGLSMGSHHTHDYVGNASTTAFSTDSSLAAAATTCTNGDRSTYYWPVLRRQDRTGTGALALGSGRHGNIGQIIVPTSASVQFRGSPVSKVIAMPEFLRMFTGDPVAATDGLPSRAQWGCSGFPGRRTTLYPRCPEGSLLTRTLDFPSCWNGLDTDSDDHRSHVAFPDAEGVCPAGMFPIPLLRVAVSYDVPPGTPIALDSFPEQRHSPATEHAGFVNVMTDGQMLALVRCVNEGRHC